MDAAKRMHVPSHGPKPGPASSEGIMAPYPPLSHRDALGQPLLASLCSLPRPGGAQGYLSLPVSPQPGPLGSSQLREGVLRLQDLWPCCSRAPPQYTGCPSELCPQGRNHSRPHGPKAVPVDLSRMQDPQVLTSKVLQIPFCLSLPAPHGMGNLDQLGKNLNIRALPRNMATA